MDRAIGEQDRDSRPGVVRVELGAHRLELPVRIGLQLRRPFGVHRRARGTGVGVLNRRGTSLVHP